MECASCNGQDIDETIKNNIEDYGLSIIGTYIGSKKKIPMTYSIGITKTSGNPEAIVFGLPHEHAKTFINMYYDFVNNNNLIIGQEYFDFAEGFPTMFIDVPDDKYKEHMIQSTHYNQQNGVGLKAVQMIYPDIDKKWPWEDGVKKDFKTAVNVLKNPEDIL